MMISNTNPSPIVNICKNIAIVALVIAFITLWCQVPKETPEDAQVAALAKQDAIEQAQTEAAIERQARIIAADMVAAKGIHDGQ